MLKISRGFATRTYENSFFRIFATNLAELFSRNSWDGLLLGNAKCLPNENLQIDALLITQYSICIIDFKNYAGNIYLPDEENFDKGIWRTDQSPIKGGSFCNPFEQLSQQKKKFRQVYLSDIQKSVNNSGGFVNPLHVHRLVCFQGEICLHGNIPQKDEVGFHITDAKSYLETLSDIIQIQTNGKDATNLPPKLFCLFEKVFVAAPFNPKEDYLEEPNTQSNTSHNKDFFNIDETKLYPDQKETLHKVYEFIDSPTEKIFILQGPKSSGKSFLKDYIRYYAGTQRKELLLWGYSTRVIQNLLNGEGESIYSKIYNHKSSIEILDSVSEEHLSEIYDSEEQNLELSSAAPEDEENYLEHYDLADNEELSDDAIILIDAAHFITDSKIPPQEMDNKQFGSGRLLSDLLTFVDVKNTSRKIIFIGDAYIASLASSKDSCLFSDFYIRNDITFNLAMLTLKPSLCMHYDALLPCVKGINAEKFNRLQIKSNKNVTLLDKTKDNLLSIIKAKLKRQTNFAILTHSNESAQTVNKWIKKKVINTGDEINVGDYVITENRFQASMLDGLSTINIPKGRFFCISEISPVMEKEVHIGSSSISLKLRDIVVPWGEDFARFCSLENFAELNKTLIFRTLKILQTQALNAYKQLNNIPNFDKSQVYQDWKDSDEIRQLTLEIDSLQHRLDRGEKVKTLLRKQKSQKNRLFKKARAQYNQNIKEMALLDYESDYWRFSNIAFLNYAWAMTVHTSRHYTWDEILINEYYIEDTIQHKQNKGFFAWLYTALSRASAQINIINHTDISPSVKIQFAEYKEIQHTSIQDYYLEYVDSNDKKNLSDMLNQLHKSVKTVLDSIDATIINVKHHNYQDIFEVQTLVTSTPTKALLCFYYTGKLQVKMPKIESENALFKVQLQNIFSSSSPITDFSFITDEWRQEQYIKLSHLLSPNFISSIKQHAFQDDVTLIIEEEKSLLSFYYTDKGFFTTVIPQNITKKSYEYIKDLFTHMAHLD